MSSKILSIAVVFLIMAGVSACKSKPKTDFRKIGITSKTIRVLKTAYCNELKSVQTYRDFAGRAKLDGYPRIALMFEVISKSESIHAANHKTVLQKYTDSIPAPVYLIDVKTTKENLEKAIKSEGFEIDAMYPDYIRTAKEEKINDARKTMNLAMQTELKHHKIIKNALHYLMKNKPGKLPSVYFICPDCGNIYVGKEPSKCDVCKNSKDKFIICK